MCRQRHFPRAPLRRVPLAALAGVGPMLCLYPDARRSELAAWASACEVCAESCVDVDGIRESLRLLDQGGDCCLRLFLLPDSDYQAWEQLRAGLPCVSSEARHQACRACSLMRRRFNDCFGGWLGGADWRASVLRIADGGDGVATLAWTGLSEIGRGIARRIAQAEGVSGPALAPLA
ncbi:Hemin transport protein [Luteimonas sp. e5]